MDAILSAILLAASPQGDVPSQEKKNPEELKVTVDVQDGTLGEVLDFLRLVSGVPIDVDEPATKKLDLTSKISFKIQDVKLVDALKLLFGPRSLEVAVIEKTKVLIRVPKGR